MIKISGDKNVSYLTVTMTDILDCMPIGNSMSWSILHIWAIWDSNKFGSMLEFEKTINKSVEGLNMPWLSLVDLGKSFSQLIEILIIGDSTESNLKRYTNDTDMYNNCSTVIELVDSGEWIVKTDIFEMENNLIERLNGEKWAG